jgi:hypothetical protein
MLSAKGLKMLDLFMAIAVGQLILGVYSKFNLND